MSYGARLLAALPPMGRLNNHADFMQKLQELDADRVTANRQVTRP